MAVAEKKGAKGWIKDRINRVLIGVGHRVDADAIIPQPKHLVRLLRRHDLSPQTVVDIGVADGTPWLYSAYPKAKYLLIDPTPQAMVHMTAIAKELNADVFNLALGSKEGELVLKVRNDHAGSTFYHEVGKEPAFEPVKVPVKRFDTFAPAMERPSLVKIDVQGAEIDVIEGFGERIRDVDCFIIETALISTLKNGQEFATLVAMMSSRDFVLYDIVGVLRRPLDQAVTYIDAMFVPRDSRMRSDKRWSSS